MASAESGRDACGRVRDLLSGLVGGRIERVQYWLPEDAPDEPHDEAAAAVNIDQGVLLSTTAGQLALAWCIDNYDEYLSVVADPGRSPAATVGPLVDVSELPAWRPLIGTTIVAAGMATTEGEDGIDLVWAVRVEVDAALSLTVALGESYDGLTRYSANNLLAIFDRRLAEALLVEPGGESAWGTDLADRP